MAGEGEFWEDLEDGSNNTEKIDYIFEKMNNQVQGLLNLTIIRPDGLPVYESDRKTEIDDEKNYGLSFENIKFQGYENFFEKNRGTGIEYKVMRLFEKKEDKKDNVLIRTNETETSVTKINHNRGEAIIILKNYIQNNLWEHMEYYSQRLTEALNNETGEDEFWNGLNQKGEKRIIISKSLKGEISEERRQKLLSIMSKIDEDEDKHSVLDQFDDGPEPSVSDKNNESNILPEEFRNAYRRNEIELTQKTNKYEYLTDNMREYIQGFKSITILEVPTFTSVYSSNNITQEPAGDENKISMVALYYPKTSIITQKIDYDQEDYAIIVTESTKESNIWEHWESYSKHIIETLKEMPL